MKIMIAAMALTAAMAGMAQAQSMAASGDAAPTIAENVAASPAHATLAGALEAAGLLETLAGAGPYTLLAPPDDAFAALPEGLMDAMMEPANAEAMRTALLCHVIEGAVVTGDLAAMTEAGTAGPDGVVLDTLGGCKLTVRGTPEGGVTVTDEAGTTANVVAADILQANGVIHVIDAVMRPADM